MHIVPNLISTFTTLFVTIGPVEAAVIFSGLTAGVHKRERGALAIRSVMIAGAVLLLFSLAGPLTLESLHISLPAFRVAGGVLLFLQALTLTFSSPGLSSINTSEQQEAKRPGDIAVFPLAFPIIAGPGALSAIVLLTGRTEGWAEKAGVLAVLVACLALTYIAMLASERLTRRLGQTGTDVVGRISGVLLAALAVQFIFDGLSQAPFLTRG